MSKRYKQCSNALFVKALQTLQTLHIFESQARVRIYVYIILPLYDTFPQILSFNHMEKWHIKYRKVGSKVAKSR